MKQYIYLLLPLLAFAFVSCEDELKEQAALSVSVVTNNNVQQSGDKITVKKGSKLNFILKGDPDFITFFSGEAGHQYIYKDRDQVALEDIVSSKLTFSVWYQYGNAATAANLMKLYISDSFTGLAKNNFKEDSVLVEGFAWNNLVDPSSLPSAPSNAAHATKYEVDFTPYLGKRMTIAACYKPTLNTAAQPRVNFVGMKIENTMKDGSVTTLYANGFNFTPINMMCHHKLADQKSMTANREYGTVTNNVSGIWNLAGASKGDFSIHSSNSGAKLKYSWLVSDMIMANACSPDYGTAIKNVTESLSSYTHIYNKVGTYKAVFVATNSNYKAESKVVRELNIEVVD